MWDAESCGAESADSADPAPSALYGCPDETCQAQPAHWVTGGTSVVLDFTYCLTYLTAGSPPWSRISEGSADETRALTGSHGVPLYPAGCWPSCRPVVWEEEQSFGRLLVGASRPTYGLRPCRT